MTELIRTVLESQGIILDNKAIEKLSQYHTLLCQWNEKMDLTNVPKDEIPLKHYVDSILPLVRYDVLFPLNSSLIDVGTGAGLPGIPLAIARPDMKVTLLDAQNKRCEFLNEVVRKAGLSNVEVLHMRAEDGGRDKRLRERFDLAAARAVAPLNVSLEYLLPFVKTGGCALAWKGPAAALELDAAKKASMILGGGQIDSMEMKYADMNHVLIRTEKIQRTASQYPRKSGTPGKNPLGGIVERT